MNPTGRTRGLHEQPDIPLDCVGLDFPAVLTKQQLWRIVQGQYNPLGLLSPYTIRFNLFLREVSVRSSMGWDEPIDEDIRVACRDVCIGLAEVALIGLPRAVVSMAGPVQLLAFGDTSTVALAACVYTRCEVDGAVKCSRVTMKTKVAPASKASVLHLELISAVMAVNLA